ncbi:hypothetical protein FRC08_013678, partial [Ceratobasidium sp. 394]
MPDPDRLTKKGRYAPPKAPKTPAGASSLSRQYSPSESVPEATPATLPTSKYRSSSAYPTPSTVRKPEQGAGTRVKSMPPLDFNAATVPPPELGAAGNPDSESLSEDEGDKTSSDSDSDSNASDAYKGEDADEENNDADEESDDEDKKAGKGVARELAREVIELDSSPRKKGKFRNVREMEEYFESMRRGAVFEESDEDLPAGPNPSSSKPAGPKAVSSKSAAPKPTEHKSASSKSAASKSIAPKAALSKSTAPKSGSSKSTAASGVAPSKPVAPKPVAPKPVALKPVAPKPVAPEQPSQLSDTPDIKMEVEEEKPEGDVAKERYNKVIVRNHVLKCMTSLCGFKKAHEAADLVALYDENGEPKWFKQEGDGEVLVPHFDRPFQDNMDGWGKVFDAVVENPSRMGEKNRAYLQTVPISTFRSVLSAGAFATMKEAWKKNQDGKGKDRQEKKKAHTRRSNRKGAKGKRRALGLDDSPLDHAKFGFLADPAFQSSDSSDPENKNRCVVHEPAYRTEVVTKLLGALDRCYNSTKKRGGNPTYTEFG